MVQELMEELIELESRKAFLNERLKNAVIESNRSIQLIEEIDVHIYCLREEIEFNVGNN
jgi:predicted ATP-binding protein involved in virulence